MSCIAETTADRVRGQREDGVETYRGARYAAPPVREPALAPVEAERAVLAEIDFGESQR